MHDFEWLTSMLGALSRVELLLSSGTPLMLDSLARQISPQLSPLSDLRAC
jgi:hypothetical protein